MKDHIERVFDKRLEDLEAKNMKGKEGYHKSIKSMTKAVKYLERCAKELQKLADNTSGA